MIYKHRTRECDKKWESSAFGAIREEWRCAQYIFRENYRDVWQWSVNKTTVICFSHMHGRKKCRRSYPTASQSFCISQGYSMISGCREELFHYHWTVLLSPFILWIISIILLSNACDSSGWRISWILYCSSHIRSGLLFFHDSLRPQFLSRVCVHVCLDVRRVPTGKTAQLKLSQTSSAVIIPDSSVLPHTHSHFSSSWAALSPPILLMWGAKVAKAAPC